MRFVSTRGNAGAVGFSEAILRGLAPDGGLYVPESWPDFSAHRLEDAEALPREASRILAPFLAGDPLEGQLEALCERAFDFPMPLVEIGRDTAVLELFHGPTAAFKDFGARFLASCLSALVGRHPAAPERLTVLVATSGDTGAAVASACHRRRGLRVGVLFPAEGVSPRQKHQLTCWDDNVRSFAVRGTFDDCQRLVKDAFRRGDWPSSGGLSSANSINVGRLLPQAMYYAVASLGYRERHGVEPGFVVPSGNVGNSAGALWAKRMGFPVRHVAMATNANQVVPRWFESGEWSPRCSVPTLANAMDVGDPSNMERVFQLYPERAGLLADASALAVGDEAIRAEIACGPARWGRVWCPHTATAVHFRERLASPHWIVVATAHPAKFDSIVEPLVGHAVEVPPALAELLARPTQVTEIEPDLDRLIDALG